jgi:hypothetical protein
LFNFRISNLLFIGQEQPKLGCPLLARS